MSTTTLSKDQGGGGKPFVSRPRYNGQGKRSFDQQEGGGETPYISRPRYNGQGKRSFDQQEGGGETPFVSRPRYNGHGKRSFSQQGGGGETPFVSRPRYSGQGKRSYQEQESGEKKPFVSRPRYNGQGKRSFDQQEVGEKKPFVSRPRYNGQGKRSHEELLDSTSHQRNKFVNPELSKDYFNGAITAGDISLHNDETHSMAENDQDQQRKGKMPYRMRHRYFGRKKKDEKEEGNMDKDNSLINEANKDNNVNHKNIIRGIFLLRDNTDLGDVLSRELKKRGFRIEQIMKDAEEDTDSVKSVQSASDNSSDEEHSKMSEEVKSGSDTYYNIRK